MISQLEKTVKKKKIFSPPQRSERHKKAKNYFDPEILNQDV